MQPVVLLCVFKLCSIVQLHFVHHCGVVVVAGRCTLTSEDIRKRYTTAKDVYESTGLLLVPVDRVTATVESGFSVTLMDETTGNALILAPAAQGRQILVEFHTP